MYNVDEVRVLHVTVVLHVVDEVHVLHVVDEREMKNHAQFPMD